MVILASMFPRSIQRIVEKHVLSVGIVRRDVQQVLVLLGGHDAEMTQVIHAPVDRLIGEIVQLLDDVAADVHPIGRTQNIHESRFGDLAPHELGGNEQTGEEAGQFAGRPGVTAFAFDDMAFQGHELLVEGGWRDHV